MIHDIPVRIPWYAHGVHDPGMEIDWCIYKDMYTYDQHFSIKPQIYILPSLLKSISTSQN